MNLGLGVVLVFTSVVLAGCGPSTQTITLKVAPGGPALTSPAQVHWEIWAAVAGSTETGTLDPGTLVQQDDVAVATVPGEVTIVYQKASDAAVQPGPGWGGHLAYWLSAQVDDWVLAPSKPVADVAQLGQNPVWNRAAAPSVGKP